ALQRGDADPAVVGRGDAGPADLRGSDAELLTLARRDPVRPHVPRDDRRAVRDEPDVRRLEVAVPGRDGAAGGIEAHARGPAPPHGVVDQDVAHDELPALDADEVARHLARPVDRARSRRAADPEAVEVAWHLGMLDAMTVHLEGRSGPEL